MNLALATDPVLACVFATQTDNPATASASDREQMLGYWRGLFQIWSNVHRQHLNGTVDPMIYASVEREIRSYAGQFSVGAATNRIEARRRLMFWAWQSEKFQFSEDFSTFVDGLINANTSARRAEDQTVVQGASTDGMPQPGQVTAGPCRG
ncbi:MAG: hypothetical protein IT472_00760 [Thermomonas sp.]|uniref:hypothetical protein n=1 Tax=Thermomonas sp. TaxID=1971895 RepID=UPI00262F3C58|nr:hypothetical protein [Thermomonas sp.]MCC7095700.1 hypothetical protein [Thermomonas sp.]